VRDRGEGGSLVDDGRLVDLLRHWDGMVDRGRLDSLPLDDGLDWDMSIYNSASADPIRRTRLVDVVMFMLIDVGA
jgi:hypothetical protein